MIKINGIKIDHTCRIEKHSLHFDRWLHDRDINTLEDIIRVIDRMYWHDRYRIVDANGVVVLTCDHVQAWKALFWDDEVDIKAS